MRRLFLFAVLLGSTSIIAIAQSNKSLDEQVKRIEEMVKNGAYSPDSFLIDSPKDADIETQASDPLGNVQDEDVIRARNDARREAYAYKQASLAEKGYKLEDGGTEIIQFDSVGIYAVHEDKMEAMKHIEAEENRVTMNDFASKWLLTFYGNSSNYVFTNGKAHFKIYFTHDLNSISAYYKMFSSKLTIEDFFIGKFKVKGKKREFVGARNRRGMIGDAHTVSKGEQDEDVKVTINKLKDNVYDMIVEGTPGEYLLTWNESNSSSNEVFDFTIK